jgi:hypothetical protein
MNTNTNGQMIMAMAKKVGEMKTNKTVNPILKLKLKITFMKLRAT